MYILMYIKIHSTVYKEKPRTYTMAKRDPYHHKEHYLAWKERVRRSIEGISDNSVNWSKKINKL